MNPCELPAEHTFDPRMAEALALVEEALVWIRYLAGRSGVVTGRKAQAIAELSDAANCLMRHLAGSAGGGDRALRQRLVAALRSQVSAVRQDESLIRFIPDERDASERVRRELTRTALWSASLGGAVLFGVLLCTLVSGISRF